MKHILFTHCLWYDENKRVEKGGEKRGSVMDSMLQQLKQDMQTEQDLRRKRDSLETEYRGLCSRAKELAEMKQKEADDVTQLEKGGMRSFFYQVTGRLQERLEEEQQEATQAAQKYAAIQQEIQNMETTLRQVDAQMQQLTGSQQRYQQYIVQKAKRLQTQGFSGRILEVQETLQSLKEKEKQLLEQKQVLHDVQWQASRCMDSLNDAQGYGYWDMSRGGMLLSYWKQERVQEAKEQFLQLKSLLEQAKESLMVQETQMENVQESLGKIEGMKFFDIFLDNFFLDWSIQDHIQNAISQLQHLLGILEEKLHCNIEALESVRTQQKQLQTEWENCVAELEEEA